MLNPIIEQAYRESEGGISKELALELASLRGPDILDLASLANKIKLKKNHREHICTIANAKSGSCPENCRYCAQSAHHRADITSYPLISGEEALRQAEAAYKNGVRHFGIVTSGRGYLKADAEFQRILEILDLLHQNYTDMELCASLGILSEETAALLKKTPYPGIQSQSSGRTFPLWKTGRHDTFDQRKDSYLRTDEKPGDQSLLGRDSGAGRNNRR